MNQATRYTRFALAREMMETASIVRSFDPARSQALAAAAGGTRRLFLTGEGSSRIFPAKNAIRVAMQAGLSGVHTDGARQAAGYDLSSYTVILASNSGRTSEVVALARVLEQAGITDRYALTAHASTVLESLCTGGVQLTCGPEEAVAATKSVVEQALFVESLIRHLTGNPWIRPMGTLADAMAAALSVDLDPAIVRAAATARMIYFAGYNDGVAEELTLKTNEITRKKSDYLEGTYAVHGVEEVMDADDVVIVIDPVPEDIDKFRAVLVDGVGLTVVAIADHDTPFPTIRIPRVEEGAPYVQLAAGWNLLVEVGLSLGIDLDTPRRARKVGNEAAE